MDENASDTSSVADDIQPIVDERIGQFLSSTPPVVEQILSHMKARDLNRCARVCKLWSKIAEGIKKRRHDFLWMFQATKFPGIDVSMITGGRDDEHCTEDMIYMTAVDDPQGVGDHFYDMLEITPIEPRTGIMFSSTHVLSKPQRYFAGFERQEDSKNDEDSDSSYQKFYYHEPFMQYLSKELPRNCRMICCGTPGIVGTPVDKSTPAEVKLLNGFTTCMFPNIPGLQIKPFSVAEEDAYSAPKRKKFDASEIAQLTGIPENVNIKALLLFCEEVPDRGGITRSIVQHYMKKQDLKIALGGAIVDTVVGPMQNKDEWPMVAGLVFTGDSVNAASIIVQSSVHTAEELEKNLVELKNGIRMTSTSRSIAFMFACCGKGCNYYEQANVEPEIFRKVFPDTLLFGCFSNGEIGITYLPNAEPPPEKKFTIESKRLKMPSWLHGYTTIFVLITW